MADTNLEVRLTAEAGDLRSELRDVEQRLSSLNRAAAKAAKGTQQLSTASRNINKDFKGVGRGAGQAGIQVQQFVGQIQGGVNPMIALSQQSADLGFALGVPLAGAIAGIAFSLAGPFLSSLLDAGEGLDELIEKAKEAGVNLRKIAPTTFKKKQDELTEAVEKAADKIEEEESQLKKLNEQFDAQIQKLKESGEEEEKEGSRLQKLLMLRTEQATAIKEQKLALEAARIEHDKAIKKLNEHTGATDDSTESTNKNTEAQKKNETFMANIRKKRFQAIVDARDARIKAEQDATKAAAAEEKKRLSFMQKINKQRFDAIVAARDAQIQKEKEAAEIVARNQAAAHKSALEQMRAEQKRFENVIEGGLNTMADGFVGVIRGTNSLASAFNNMANQIINDLLRMAMQKLIVDRIMGAVFGGGGSIATVPGFTSVGPAAGAGGASGGQAVLPGLADGGTARAGRAHIVGERGPELLVPGRTSQVIPNHALGGVNVTQNINISTGVQQTVRAEIAGLMPQIAEASKNAVIDARRRGGSFAGAFGA